MFQTRVATTHLVPPISIAAGLALLGSPSAAVIIPGDVLVFDGSPAAGAAGQRTTADGRSVPEVTTGCQPSWLPVDGAPGLNGVVLTLEVLAFGGGPRVVRGGGVHERGRSSGQWDREMGWIEMVRDRQRGEQRLRAGGLR